MTANDDHEPLITYTRECVSALLELPAASRLGSVHYDQHRQFAARGHDLGLTLSGALALSEMHLYPASFALIRAALEHRLFDSLLFLATRLRERREGVEDAQFRDWVRQWETEPELKKSLRGLARNSGGNVEMVWDGPWVVDGHGKREYRLSVYYRYLQQYDPFGLSDRLQNSLATNFRGLAEHQQAAKENLRVWRQIRWEGLLDNLSLNRLVSSPDLVKLRVHYGFLSAFAHPLTLKANEAVYGRTPWAPTPRYDHYSSELALAYIATLACWEIADFLRMSRRKPLAPLANPDHLESLVDRRAQHCSYLWFVGDFPHRLDFVNEANHRGLRRGRLLVGAERLRPEDLTARRVKYYRNPLQRMVQLHSSFHELVGFEFRSDWDRSDAYGRL